MSLTGFIYLGREDGSWVAGFVQKCDIQLHRDVRAGRDLVCARACGVELASLCATVSLQVHTLFHRVETNTLCECTLHLASKMSACE